MIAFILFSTKAFVIYLLHFIFFITLMIFLITLTNLTIFISYGSNIQILYYSISNNKNTHCQFELHPFFNFFAIIDDIVYIQTGVSFRMF